MVGAARRQERRGPDHAVRRHGLRDQVRVRGEGLGRRRKWFDKRELKHVDRFLQFGVAAGDDGASRTRASASKVPGRRRSIAGASTSAPASAACGRSRTPTRRPTVKGPRHGFSPYFVTDIIINEAPGMVSIRTGATRPEHLARLGVRDRRALDRRGDARDPPRLRRRHDRRRRARRRSSILGVGGFNAMRAMSTRNDAPEKASRPFDKDRDGFVIGEGAGILVLEELEQREEARRADLRRARRLRRERATRTTSRRRRPSTRARRRASSVALEDAKLDPTSIGYINAHGTSTELNDKNETFAIEGRVRRSREEARDVVDQVDDRPHARRGRRHRGRHHRARDRARRAAADDRTTRRRIPSATSTTCRTQPREQRVDHAMSNSFGFGGTNAALDPEPLQG